MRNHNDRVFDALQARTRADRWLANKVKTTRWFNPLGVVWMVWWFAKVRHTHYVVNYWRMVGVMEAYHGMLYRVVSGRGTTNKTCIGIVLE